MQGCGLYQSWETDVNDTDDAKETTEYQHQH